MSLFLTEMRINQWAKNFLLFLPLVMAHKIFDITLLSKAAHAFFAFGFCASSIYLLNDLFDIKSDQNHPTKKFRPLASGDININLVRAFIPIFCLLGLFIGYRINIIFFQLLLLYIIICALYTFWLKGEVLVDTFTLAGLYTIRIFAGAIATNLILSEWFLAFSVFFFLNLAYLKRHSELKIIQDLNQNKAPGRHYYTDDLSLIASFGTASGYIAALVLARYVNSENIKKLYSHPHLIWLICPLLLFWINRLWLLSHRGQMIDDPILFTLKDKISYLVAFAISCILFLAI